MGLYAAYACDEGSGSTITDHSGNGRDMTISGSGNSWVTGHGSYAAAFEGAISGSNGAQWDGGSLLSALSGDVSLMGWVQSQGTSTQQAFGFGIYQAASTARIAAYAYRTLNSTAASPQFTVRDSASNLYSFGSNGTTADSSWHHFACVYHAAGTFDVYLDGTLVGSYATTGGNPIGTTVRYFGLGALLAGTQAAAAAVNDFRVFDSALTGTDVVTYMNTPVASSGVSGAGSVRAHKARLAGAGSESDPGSGAVRAHKALLSAAGHSTVSGSAQVRAVRARLAATGTQRLTGTGSARAVKAALAGAGHPSLAGTGAVRAVRALLAGTGRQTVSGTGSARAAKARASGAQAGPVTGTGGVRAARARVSGSSGPAVLPVYPDVPHAVCDLLASLANGADIETPAGLQDQVPWIRVTRTGGESDLVTDRAALTVDVFATGATEALDIARRALQRLIRGPFRSDISFRTQHGQVDRATVAVGPELLPPTDSDNLRLVTASYNVSMRR